MARVDVRDGGVFVLPSARGDAARIMAVAGEAGQSPGRTADGGYLFPLRLAARLREALPAPPHRWSDRAKDAADGGGDDGAAGVMKERFQQAMSDPLPLVSDLPFLDRLDWHQVQALAAMVLPGSPGLALFDEQGTGKTVMALSAYALLRRRGEIDRLVVVGPKSTLGVWEKSADTWLDGGARAVVVSGAMRARSRAITAAEEVLITSYESAAADLSLLRAWARAHSARTMLVVDESFYVKNRGARRSQAIASLRTACSRAYALCGTPAPNAEIDVVNQIDLVDDGMTFGTLDPRRAGGRAQDPGAAETIRALFRARAPYVRRLKAEVLPGLAPRHFERVMLPLAPRQGDIYREAADALCLELRTIDDKTFVKNLSSYLARRLFLLQVCSHPAAVVPGYQETPGKWSVIEALLRDLVDTKSEKVVLWSFFRYSLKSLAERFKAYRPVLIDGSVGSVAERAAAVKSFQEDRDVRLFIGNPAAAGMGLTLTASRHVVYESFSNQAVHYLQSLDRVHRRGQEREVFYHLLLSSGTIEIHEYERILRKERAAAELLGDRSEPPVTRERLIEELEGGAP